MITAASRRSVKRQAPRLHPVAAFHLVIRDERRQREWTQRQMGDFLGVDQSTVARWEAGTRTPPTAELTRLGHLLDITWQTA